MLKTAFAWALARVREPSTWAGLASVAIAAGHAFPELAPETSRLAAVAGGMAIVVKETSNVP